MKTNTLFFILLMTILCSCGAKHEGMTEMAAVNDLKSDKQATQQAPKDEVDSYNSKLDISNKKIIKDGSLTIKTNDITVSKKSIDELLKKLNGYYETENLVNCDNSINFNLKIRIPAENFEKFISDLEKGKEEIENKNIQARDVTEEYVDIESRIMNKREYLKRYKDLLSKASTVKDILAIEEEIRKLQEEIESKEGRLQYLKDQVAFSTLDINLYKEKEYIYKSQQQDSFWERVKRSLNGGWKFIIGFVLFVISLWPLIIMTFVTVFIVRRVRENKKSRQSK
jgi:Domain of unknown function (DUF4349)